MRRTAMGTYFNDDLLANTGDQSKCTHSMPRSRRFLYHKNLVDYSTKYNTRPNGEEKSRAWEVGNCTCATAIALAAVEIARPVPGWRFVLSVVLGLVAASCGLLSIAIGAPDFCLGKENKNGSITGSWVSAFGSSTSIIYRAVPGDRGFLLKGDKANKLKSKFRSDRRRLVRQLLMNSRVKSTQIHSVIGPYVKKDFWADWLSGHRTRRHHWTSSWRQYAAGRGY